MYLPSVALAGLAALGVATVLSHEVQLRPIILASCAIIICLLIVSTSQRVPQWRSQSSLAQAGVESAPNSSRAWSNLANALSEEGVDWMKIGPPMMKALELDPNNPLAVHLYAIRMVELRRFDEAEKLLNRLAPQVQRDHAILNTWGMLYFERGDFPDAVMQFEKAIELNPFAPEFRYNLALAHELSGKCREARDKWSTYLQKEPSIEKQAKVRMRIEKKFETEGAHCFGWDK
jgi:tetratricopeptide (TPR) repeat protein